MSTLMFWIAVLVGFGTALFAVLAVWSMCKVTGARVPEVPRIKAIAFTMASAAAFLAFVIIFPLGLLTGNGGDRETALLAGAIGLFVAVLATLGLLEMLCDLDSVSGGPDSLFE